MLCQLWWPVFRVESGNGWFIALPRGKSERFLLITGGLIRVIEEERVQRGPERERVGSKGRGWVGGAVHSDLPIPRLLGGGVSKKFSHDHQEETGCDLF